MSDPGGPLDPLGPDDELAPQPAPPGAESRAPHGPPPGAPPPPSGLPRYPTGPYGPPPYPGGPPPYGPPGTGSPPAYPGGPPPYGPPPYPGGYPPPYGPPGTGSPLVLARQTNGFSIASLVCSCVGVIPFLGILGVILGITFGFIALGQIRRTGGVQEGRGLAIAGIVVGAAVTVGWILLLALAAGTAGGCTMNSAGVTTCR